MAESLEQLFNYDPANETRDELLNRIVVWLNETADAGDLIRDGDKFRIPPHIIKMIEEKDRKEQQEIKEKYRSAMDLKMSFLKKKYPNAKVVSIDFIMEKGEQIKDIGEEVYLLPAPPTDVIAATYYGLFSITIYRGDSYYTTSPQQTINAMLRQLEAQVLYAEIGECCVCYEKSPILLGCHKCSVAFCRSCRDQFINDECPQCRATTDRFKMVKLA
jgi:hypothetical protein